MAVNNHFLVALERPKHAYALLSDEPQIALIFVHGFCGNSHSTWIDFQNLIDQQGSQFPLFGVSDLFFYCYPSHDQIVPLAEELTDFVNEVTALAARPKPFELPSGYRLSPEVRRREPYKHVVLVGHSTGAVIIRQAVVDELRSLEESGRLAAWVSDKAKSSLSPIAAASLRFFAPAHRGVLEAGWLGVALTFPIVNLLFTLWLHSNPLYRSLSAGNPILEDLKTATERLHAKYPDVPALTARSIFGSKDAVVRIGGYQHDKVETVPDHSHTSVCKPSVHYSKPLEFVTDGLFGAAATK